MAPVRRFNQRQPSSDRKNENTASASSPATQFGAFVGTSRSSAGIASLSGSPSTATSPPPSLGQSARPESSSAAHGRPNTSAENSGRKVAAMNRAPMACVSCREAKHRCDGQPPAQLIGAPLPPPRYQDPTDQKQKQKEQIVLYPADQECKRCNINKIECLWAPKAKLGRPSKKSATQGAAQNARDRQVGRESRIASGSGTSRGYTASSTIAAPVASKSASALPPSNSLPQATQSLAPSSAPLIEPLTAPSRDDDLSWLALQQSYQQHSVYQQTSPDSISTQWQSPVSRVGSSNTSSANLRDNTQAAQSSLHSSFSSSSSGIPSHFLSRQQQQAHLGSGQGSLHSPLPSSSPSGRDQPVEPWSSSFTGILQRFSDSSNPFDAQSHASIDRGQQSYPLDAPIQSRYGEASPQTYQQQQPYPIAPPSSVSPSSGSMSGSMLYSRASLFPSHTRKQEPTRAPVYTPATSFTGSSSTGAIVASGTATSHSHSDPYTIRAGLELYFARAPRYCLAVAPCQQYYLFASLEGWAWSISQHPRAQLPEEARDFLTLAQTVATVGWRLSDDPSAMLLHRLFLQQARDGLGGIISRPSDEFISYSIRQLVSCLQGLLLGSTLEYALDSIERSGSYLQRAADIIIRLGIPIFDLAFDPTVAGRSGEHSSIPPVGIKAAQVAELNLADDVRRCFWELCITQTMFCASTNGDPSMCLLRSGIPIEISFPDSPPPSTESDYGLRVRAASLLLESVQSVPPNLNARLNRLEALNSVVASLSQQARHRFDNGLTEESIEMTYTAYTMLNSARIQLTRITFFPGLSYELESATLAADRPAGRVTLTANLPLQVARAAIKTIIQGADNIIELTRIDHRPRPGFPNLYGSARLPVSPLLNHSPFHGSAPLAASFAYVAAAALWKDLVQSMPFRQKDGRVADTAETAGTASSSRSLVSALSEDPRRGLDSQDTTPISGDGRPGGSSGDSGTNRDVDGGPGAHQGTAEEVEVLWRHDEVLENLNFAQNTLLAATHVWPIAGKLAAEVTKCKRLVEESSLSDGR